MAFQETGTNFAQVYYQCVGSNRPALVNVYRNESLCTWTKDQLYGVQNIMGKINNLPFSAGTIFHPEEIECHPTAANTVLVVVLGKIKQPDEEHTLSFMDTFNLQQDANGWFVANEIFKVLGGAD